MKLSITRLREIINANKAFLDSLATMIKIIGVVIAPAVFYWEYLSKIDLERSQRALEEIKSFKESAAFALIEKYNIATLDSKKNTAMIGASDTTLKTGEYCAYHIWILTEFGDLSIKQNVYAVASRAETLAACANSGVCRRKELCSVLSKPIHAYMSDLCTVVSSIEGQWKASISGEIRAWLQSCGDETLKQTFCDVAANRFYTREKFSPKQLRAKVRASVGACERSTTTN